MFLDQKRIKLSDVQIEDNTPYFSTKSLSGKYQKRIAGPQFFILNFTANWMVSDLPEIKRFVAEHKFNVPFEYPMSYFSNFTGNITGFPVASTKVNKGSRLILLTGFVGTIPAGTVVQFTNHSKIYTVTESVSSNGAATLKIFPALYQDVNLGEQTKYQNLKAKFVLTNEKFTFPNTQIGNFKFTAMEFIQ